MNPNDRVNVLVGNDIVAATIRKVNHKTIWVELPDGNIVKRHKIKHKVTPL